MRALERDPTSNANPELGLGVKPRQFRKVRLLYQWLSVLGIPCAALCIFHALFAMPPSLSMG